jgi:hypothetical protein
MSELRLLITLRLRQWRASLVPILRLFGYNPGDRSLKEFLYNLYLIAFFVVWFIFGTWGAILYQATKLGDALSYFYWQQLIIGLPWVFFLLLVGMALRYARRTPLLLSFPDIAYIAGSPAPRRMLTLVQFGQEAAQTSLVVLPLTAVIAVILAQSLPPEIQPFSSARTILITVPLLLLILGSAWVWGVVRLSVPGLVDWRGYRWLPLLLLILPLVWPTAALWPGNLWLSALTADWTAAQAGLLCAVIGLLLFVLLALSSHLNLVDVADESITFAQIQALGPYARLLPELALARRTIKRQTPVTGKRPFLHLPTVTGNQTLVYRSGLVLLREGSDLLILLGWGAIFTATAQLILTSGVGPEFWIYWLLGVLVLPPRKLVSAFRADLAEPFLRQFLPLPTWRLLILDTVVPWLLLLAGALAVWLFQPVLSPLLLVLVSLLLVLCQGLALLRMGRQPLPYAVWALAALGPVLALGIWLPGTATAVAALAVGLLTTAVVYNSLHSQ